MSCRVAAIIWSPLQLRIFRMSAFFTPGHLFFIGVHLLLHAPTAVVGDADMVQQFESHGVLVAMGKDRGGILNRWLITGPAYRWNVVALTSGQLSGEIFIKLVNRSGNDSGMRVASSIVNHCIRQQWILYRCAGIGRAIKRSIRQSEGSQWRH